MRQLVIDFQKCDAGRNCAHECELECAVERDPGDNADAPQKVLVSESRMEDALEAIEAMSEPDDLIADA